MCKALTRNAILLTALSILILVSASRPALARKATGIRGAWCGPYLANTAPAHASYARQSRRGYWYCHPRPLTRDETEQLFECLLSQPFVTCEGRRD